MPSSPPQRVSIEIASFGHANPIPAGCRMGPLLVSSVIPPYLASTRQVPDGIDAQLSVIFDRAGELLEAAGGGWRHVAKMTFFVSSIDHREAINGPWVARFPDPHSRPARHTLVQPLSSGQLVCCDVMAWIS